MLFTEDTIGEFFEKQVKKDPNHDFLIYSDRNLRFTYKEFDERVNLFSKGLISLGVSKGDHVGIWAKNVPDWITFLLATAKIGAILITVNTAYKSHELAYILKQSDMKFLAIVDGFKDVDYINTIYELVPEIKTQEKGKLKNKEFPHLKGVIYLGKDKHRGMYNTRELMLLGEQIHDEEFLTVKKSLNNQEVIYMLYTSGTTGFPKGVMLTHRNILNNGYYPGERQKFTDKDKLCHPIPLFHCFGIVGVISIITHGATLVMLDVFDPLMVLATIQKEQCTAVYGVPTMFIAEYTHPMFNLFDLSSLRTGIMAGSPCPIEVVKKVMKDMYMKEITIAYGLTEATAALTITHADDPIKKKLETVGTPMPHSEVKIIDPKTGKTLGPNQTGEIICRGYNVMKEYYKMPGITKETIGEDGWLHTGDLATVDEDGYYKIVDRIKDIIIRGGENIYSLEIEEFLHAMPGIKDVQVVGVPDEKYGEIVGAFVIRDDEVDMTEEDVRDYALTKIARYKVPKHVFFVNNFPLTASGKVQKFKLREQATELIKTSKR
jgi:fatty-acyl-CoA synthase